MQMRKRVCWSLPEDLIQDIESRKGLDVPTSRFVERAIRRGLEHAEKAEC